MHRISVEFRPVINKIVISNPEHNTSRGLAVPEKVRHVIPEILRGELQYTDEITIYTVFSLFLIFLVCVVILMFFKLKKKKLHPLQLVQLLLQICLLIMTSHRLILKLTLTMISVQGPFIRQVKSAKCPKQSIQAVHHPLILL